MKIFATRNNAKNLIISNCKIADNFVLRILGLLPYKTLSENEGLLLKPSNSIHTFFMRMTIDVIFIDKNNKIIKIYHEVKPFRILPIHLNSRCVIETAGGICKMKNLQKGDIISFNE